MRRNKKPDTPLPWAASETSAPADENAMISLNEGGEAPSDTGKRKERKAKKAAGPHKKRHIVRNLFLVVLSFFLIATTAACIYIYSILADVPEIDPNKMTDFLSENTKIYDDAGQELETVFSKNNRELASVDDMTENLPEAFIAIEDKTFKEHHGLNIIRIFGAIRDGILSDSRVGGTSTITQQLARNIYLPNDKSERSIRRKVIEAYYAIQIERSLTKKEILYMYLNYIYLGYNSYGVQTAAHSYFSKDVSELSLAQCAALAALPKAPSLYSLVEFVPGGTAAEYNDVLLSETPEGVYIMNDKSKDRRELCLKLMLDQGRISQEEYDEAVNTPLASMLNPDYSTADTGSSYFEDFLIDRVISDLMEKNKWDYDTAHDKVYAGGLRIYSTMDSQAQGVILQEFADNSNYPYAHPSYDSAGNILATNGNVLLYGFDNYFDNDGNYILSADNFERKEDGSLLIKYGGDLNIYDTTLSDGTSEASLEFKNFYTYGDDNLLYSIAGGYINIPQSYKTRDEEGNLIISSDFFQSEDYQGWLVEREDGSLAITPSAYSLNSKTVQPQAAMTIVENATGYIKAMVGGRNTKGRRLFNRAVSPRQPGSSIKPLGVYAPALQQSAEEAASGVKHKFTNYHFDKQGDKLYGDYLTASSIVIDEKMVINGQVWPLNFDRTYFGFQTLRTGLMHSLNTCAVKVWYQVGLDYSLKTVKNFGISTLVEEGDTNDLNPSALALGGLTKGTTTLEMASAFSVFANNGVRYDTCPYTKVTDSAGNVLLESTPTEHEVLDPGVAWIMGDLLHYIVQNPTGYGAAISGVFVGGKTGTSSELIDDWFDGFTPTYSASLWIGNDFPMSLSEHSVVATNMWGRIMRQVDRAYEGSRMDMPSNVVVVNGEYYIQGTQGGIKTKDDLTEKKLICKDSGYLATPICPNTEEKEFLTYGQEEGEDGPDAIPKFYCNKHNHDVATYPIDPNVTLEVQEEEEPEDPAHPSVPVTPPVTPPGGEPGQP